jgi:UDP-N-acetylglucosamine 2-epimerase (non-hydrolysing)
MPKKILFIFGTRPEAIKMAPLINESLLQKDIINCKVCTTGQHIEMLQQVVDFFEIKVDYQLELMKPNQTLFDITTIGISLLKPVLDDCKPDLVIVQGDTTTAFIGALSAFYNKIPVAHIEAGLRSFDNLSPFPEEVNRKMISTIANYHFAPTVQAANNLNNEGISKHVYNVGNTVIDALFLGLKMVTAKNNYNEKFSFLDQTKEIVLITAHRRESFGEPFNDICNAILYLADKYSDIQFVFPVHPNPNILSVVNEKLTNKDNIFIIKPLSYPELIWLMDKSYFIITDSGGIQEEAPSLSKPILVIREVTERMEGVNAGTAILTGTSKQKLIESAEKLINDITFYQSMALAVNPYGDGTSAKQTISIISKILNLA